MLATKTLHWWDRDANSLLDAVQDQREPNLQQTPMTILLISKHLLKQQMSFFDLLDDNNENE